MRRSGFERVGELVYPTFEMSDSGIAKSRVLAKISGSGIPCSDGSGTEKIGFGWVREFPKFENSGSGISGMKKVGFGRERGYPNFQKSDSGMSGIGKVEFKRVIEFRQSGIFR